MVKARSRDRALFEHADSRKFAQFASTILRFELLQETFRGEIPARTAGVNRVDLLMHPDGVGAEVTLDQEELHQRVEALQLPLRGAIPVEIAHQTDADALFVQRFAGQMPAVELGPPSSTDGNLAVLHRAT